MVGYLEEITGMMYGFGDANSPNPETVRLVENLTQTQLKTIVKEALKCSNDGKTVRGEDIVQLMRHNVTRMRRFVKYLRNRKLKRINANNLQFTLLDGDGSDRFTEKMLRFVGKLDETGEFIDTTAEDDVNSSRQHRADLISRALNKKQYMEYCKARSVSFCARNCSEQSLERLENWITSPKTATDGLIFKSEALEVLAYLAHQTVAEIVDYALLVRMDSKHSQDPLRCGVMGYSATMFNVAQTSGAEYDLNELLNGQLAITVAEVEEAMRRIQSARNVSLNFGESVPLARSCLAL